MGQQQMLLGGGEFRATGGTITEVNGRRIHRITANENFVVEAGYREAECLLVGGAAGAGGANQFVGGGGAGGEVEEFTQTLVPGTYPVVIGQGGPKGTTSSQATYVGQNGTDSTAFGKTAKGGGGGGSPYTNGQDGGSGGGGGGGNGSGPGIVNGGNKTGDGFCNDGGDGFYSSTVGLRAGGGGGGADGPGGNASSGTRGTAGPGKISLITGSAVEYGRGGRGAQDGDTATDGAANTGEGGSPGTTGGSLGNGGSGVFIISYPI